VIDLDKTQFLELLLRTLQVFGKKADRATLDQWFRALKGFTLPQVQTAMDQHVKFGRYAPRPGDIVRRINGADAKGETKEGTAHMPSTDRRCVYEQNGARCPAPTGFFHFGNRGYCHEHGKHQSEPAHMQRILDDYLLNGVPGPPPTPHRQRAEYLYALGGADLVLAGKPCNDGTTWGPYERSVVAWLEISERAGGVRAFSYVPPASPPKTVAELTGFAEIPDEPELAF
jgi:hypothetical protein